MPEDEEILEDATEDEELDDSDSEETPQNEEDEPEEDEASEESVDDEPEELDPSDTSIYGKNGKLLGKYTTTQDALIGHKHLQQAYNRRESELTKLREFAASNGYTVSHEGELVKQATTPSTETAPTNTPATAPEPPQVDIPAFMQPDYVPYSVGEDGYMRDELGCVTMTEEQWKQYRDENLTDEFGNVDWQEFFRVKGQVDQEHQQNRVSALAQRESVVSKISSHNKAVIYDREVAEARSKILADYDFIPDAAEVMRPFFEHAEKVVEGIPPLERYKPGIAKQATLLAIADKFDDFTAALRASLNKAKGSTAPQNKGKTPNAGTQNGNGKPAIDSRGNQQRTVVITDGKTGNSRPSPSSRAAITPQIRKAANDLGLDPQKYADYHNSENAKRNGGAAGRNGRRG